MYIKRSEDLVIYKIALQLATEIAELIKNIPHNWKIKEGNQIIRSSSSVPSNISEGFAQRFYSKQFIRYLNIALGSSDETQSHMRKLKNDGYVEVIIADCYTKRYKNLSVRILNFISYLKNKHKILL